MLHRVLKLYILFGFCVVCIRSISITSLERLICESGTHKPNQSCIGTFILPNVVLTTSNCAEKCFSVGKLPIVRTFIHPHYRNFVQGKDYVTRNDIALVVTQQDKKKRKLMKLSVLDNLTTMGLKALVPIMDADKPRLAVAIVERCYIEQPFGYYVCASNRVSQRTVQVCQERQEQGVPLLIEDRIFGIMGITDKDRCKLPQRSFTALAPALDWISETVRTLGYDDAVITTLHDMTSTSLPRPPETTLFTSTTHPTQTLHPTTTTPPPTTTIEETKTSPHPTTPPLPTSEEHYNPYPAETPSTASTRLYPSTPYTIVTSPEPPKPPVDSPPKPYNIADAHHDNPPPKPPNPAVPHPNDLLPEPPYPFDPDPEDNTHPSYSPPSTDSPKVTDIPSASHDLTDNGPQLLLHYTALEKRPTFPRGFTIDPSLIVNLRGNQAKSYLTQTTQRRPTPHHLYVNGIISNSPYPSVPNAYGPNVLRLFAKEKRRQVENKNNAIDYFRNAHKSLNSFNIGNAKNDFIIPDVSPVLLPVTLNRAPPVMRTRKVISSRRPQPIKRITAITFVPRATTLSKSSAPKKTTKLTTNRTKVIIPFSKVLEDIKTTNVMDWFKVMVKDKLKNETTSAVFYVATTTTTEAYSPLSSQRPLNFIDLT